MPRDPRYPEPIGSVVRFFDRLEDRVRHALVRNRILYALIASVGLVIFWRGIWALSERTPLIEHPIVSTVVGFAILAVTGVYVTLIGTEVISATLEREGRTLREIKRSVTREADADKEGEKRIEEHLTSERQETGQLLREVEELRTRIDRIIELLQTRKE